MNHLKIFEDYQYHNLPDTKHKPDVGDYVIANCDKYKDSYQDFLLNNIGEIIDIDDSGGYINKIEVSYDSRSIPAEFNSDNCFTFEEDQILFFSYNKKELEDILTANKYNL